ncbi:hypothetical protein X728_16815 [Mesorhizobium sp. L103C120A0]|nr:hypothetical protein X728_16815 [Mesorhizobium sp. L103C120A0]
MAEGQDAEDFARVGSVQVLGQGPSNLSLRYQYDLTVPPIAQDRLRAVAAELGLSTHGRQFDWTHTHWSVQEGDLYRTLFRLTTAIRNSPTVFTLNSPPRIDTQQVSAMMPFEAGFAPVYRAIEAAAVEANMRCNRADNIWEHHTVIQDVVSLIDRSSIVVCDLSGRNPNVFYEAGIAHSLGREVILITRQPEDVPFDLRHIRYIHYHNNDQGLATLQQQLAGRIRALQ